MECQPRSCHKHTLLQMWCGLLTVSMVIMAAFLASLRPESEEVSITAVSRKPWQHHPNYLDLLVGSNIRLLDWTDVTTSVGAGDEDKNGVSALKLDGGNQTAASQKHFLKSDGTSYIELVKSLDGGSWDPPLRCERCSLLLLNNSIHSTARSVYFVYAQVSVSVRKQHQAKSVALVRDATPYKKAKTLVKVPTVAGGSVWLGKMVRLAKGDSVSLNIAGEFQRDDTYWGAFQLH
ncbi:uncharacterized protein LOC133440643 [Cololabis saira]|uniref:uncharacterized protein LOC133440643 n=1 Tax=Cololabis saira TaxID=129043 RepID=UPI002AD364E3|nr:uncharacterized protein LOC133440643 [Cololabis saira]